MTNLQSRFEIRTYKRKLILTPAQDARIRSWIGACRVVYNMGLEIKKAAYSLNDGNISNYELQRQLSPIRQEYDWMNDVPHDCLIASLDKLDRAYKKFFKTYKLGGGFPRFSSKRKCKSISFKSLSIKNGNPVLPKLGALKIFKDAPIIGTPRTAQIIIEPTGFFLCIQCRDVPPKFHSENQAIGLDMGISHFCIDSNGNFISNPRHFKKYERKLKIENRSLARKKKGSNSWIKQANKLNKLHHKVGKVRKDFLHKVSTRIAKENSMVFIEDLKIRSMANNRNLAKHILDCGWGVFKIMLQYKTNVVLVNPKYTSQTCFECGAIDSKSRFSRSEFCCTSCGHMSNADINAAKNILSRGTALVREREAIACALDLEPKGMSVPQGEGLFLTNLKTIKPPTK